MEVTWGSREGLQNWAVSCAWAALSCSPPSPCSSLPMATCLMSPGCLATTPFHSFAPRKCKGGRRGGSTCPDAKATFARRCSHMMGLCGPPT